MNKDKEIKILKELLDYAVLDWELTDALLDNEMKNLSSDAKNYFKNRYRNWWKE